VNLQLDQRTELACKALLLLNEDDESDHYMPRRIIAERLDLSPDYLTKVLAPLSHAGWITSATGPAGGYRLTANLSELCVLDLIEAVEGRIDRERCLHGDSRNPVTERCTLHDPWIRARDALLTELEETPIAVAGLPSPREGE
jgi:Rrf2 family protein